MDGTIGCWEVTLSTWLESLQCENVWTKIVLRAEGDIVVELRARREYESGRGRARGRQQRAATWLELHPLRREL